MSEKLIFPIGFDLTEGVAQVEKDWGNMQKKLQDTFKSQTIKVDADISKAVLDKLYAKFEGLIKTMESKAPQIKLKIPDTVDFEQEINRLKVQLKSINLGELTDAESKDLYLYIRQLEALAKALKEVNKQEQLRQANRPEVIALRQAQAEEKRTRSLANSALAEQRRAKIATESARQDEINTRKKMRTSVEQARINEINNRSAQRGAVIAEQRRAATARAEQAELRLTQAMQRSTKATHAQNTAYQAQGSYLSRLITRMAAYMSIHQVLSWVKQLREVTAEFELQRVSLGALIQDAYKANTIFERIKIQAVKSPYEIKDLVTYTKRLAAYGVEADDLMGTMNRLADISAGLGADMDRIILAYGQIQAAGVLKGTELRQLTELGIPMVELLAQYYTTLRNETISTAEVFDMISKKEVPFEAVKDILTDLTDEGGRFFDMQSKQAETLAGQWSNMKDTLSIMFDEIGRTEEVQEALHGWIDLVKWLALNWEEVGKQILFVGKTVGTIWALSSAVKAYNAIMAMSMAAHLRYRAIIIGGMKLYRGILSLQVLLRLETYKQMAATIKLNLLRLKELGLMGSLQLAMKKTLFGLKAIGIQIMKLTARIVTFMLTNPVGWAFAIAGAIAAITLNSKRLSGEGVDSMEKFNESLKEVTKEAIRNTEKLVANFGRLAREASSATNGSKKQQEALRRLQQQYGEIFTAEELEIENLRRITKGTEEAKDAFDRYAASIRSFEQARFEQEVIEQYYTKLEEKFKDVFSLLTDEHGKNYASLIGYIQRYAPTWGEKSAEDILKEVIKKYMEDTGLDKLHLIEEDGVTADDFHLFDLMDMKMSELMKMLELTRANEGEYINKYASAEILMLYELAHGYAYLNEDVTAAIKSFKDLDPAMSAAIDRSQELAHEIDNVDIEPLVDKETGEEISRTEEEVKKAYDKAINDLAKAKGKDLLSNLELSEEEFEINPTISVNPNLELTDEQKRAITYFNEEVNQLLGVWGDQWKKDLSDMVRFLDEGTRKVQVYSTDQIKGFTTLSQSVEESAKKYKELNEEKERLAAINTALSKLDPTEENLKMLEENEQALSKINAQMEMLYAYLSKYGGLGLLEDKKSSPKTDPRIKQLEEELSMVEKIYKKYEEYRKTMGDAEAKALVEKYFEGVDLKWLKKAFSTTELKAQAQEALKIIKTFWGDTKKAQQNIQFKIGDIDYNETKRELEQKMKKLSDDISRTKTAKEFFDRMLGMTGDKELSATLTLSVYGTTGDDLQRLMTQQVEDAFRNLPKDISFDSARLFGDNRFDYNILAGWIDKLPEDDRKVAQSIVDNWRKANADILADIQKSYEDFMTYEERRTRVAEKYAVERKKIMESELPDDEKKKYVKAANKRENKELTDIAIEEFKASEDWAKSFEDLENLASPTIERLMAKLKEFIDTQEDLTPEQLKTLTNEYKKLYDGLIQRNPFKAISDGVKEYKMSIQGIKLAQEQLNAAIAIGDEELIAFAERGLTDAFDEAQKTSTKLKKGVDAVGDQFSQAASDIQFFANALGFSEDSYATQFLNGMANAFKGVSIAIGFADIAMKIFDGTIKAMLASNPIGWILLAVSAIISAVQAIMNARINRINKEIEVLEDKLDNLEYAYDRLQKSAEQAFGTEYIQNYQRQLANLEAQVEAYEKQLELERSKGKKADEDKIKEYENQIRDAKDAIKDMYDSLSEHFLGQDLTSAARDFASAWIDAYKEFANTTDAMKAKFQDMIQNMIAESLIAKVMERALRPVFTMVDEMGDSDFYSNSFWSQLMTEMNKATENGVVGAQNIMGMLESIGINLRDTGTGLTGISRDIASASEESILGLAAGINTQNFYISQVPTKLDTIIGLLRGGSAVVDSGVNVQDLITIQNQFLSHLPTIAQNTAETVARCERAAVACESMASKLGSVIKPKGTTSTHSVNVTIGS